MNGETEQTYSIDELKPIEAGEQLDLAEYEGRKSKIEKVEVMEVDSIYDDKGQQLPPGQTVKAKVLKITTESLGKIQTQDGEKEIRASELLSLKKKADGSWGWSTHKKAKIQKLFKRLETLSKEIVNEPKHLIGKQVTVIIRPGDEISWLGILI